MLAASLSAIKNTALPAGFCDVVFAALSGKKLCKERIGVNSAGLAPILFFQTEYNLHKFGTQFSRSEKAFVLRAANAEAISCTDSVVRKSRFYMLENALFLPAKHEILFRGRLLSAGSGITHLAKNEYFSLPDAKNTATFPDSVYVVPPGINAPGDFAGLISQTLPYLYSVLESFPEKPLTILLPEKDLPRTHAHAYRYIKKRYPHIRFLPISAGADACLIPHLLHMERSQNAPASFIDPHCLQFISEALPLPKISPVPGGKYYLAYRGDEDDRDEYAALAPILRRAGYELRYADIMPHAKLAEIFANASSVIGPDSPAFANMVYAKKNCDVTIFYPPDAMHDFYLWLAKSIGLRPSHLSMEFDASGRSRQYVAPELLMRALSSIAARADAA